VVLAQRADAALRLRRCGPGRGRRERRGEPARFTGLAFVYTPEGPAASMPTHAPARAAVFVAAHPAPVPFASVLILSVPFVSAVSECSKHVVLLCGN